MFGNRFGNINDFGIISTDITVDTPVDKSPYQTLLLRFQQDSVGGHNVTLTNPGDWDGNLIIDGAPNAITELWVMFDGTRYHFPSVSGAGFVNIKAKAGAPADGDYNVAPPDGTIVGDSTNSKFWIRLGGAWKGVAVA